jgi:hypothetical protein
MVFAAPIVWAQGSEPLHKADLVRLLASPLISQGEVADVVRRNCLAFRPTERDWADLRAAGAGGEIMANVAGCATRGPGARGATAAPTAPAPPLDAIALPAEYEVPAGTPASVRVQVRRGDAPQRGVPLLLRGSRSLGLPRDASAVSDDSGYATFRLPGVAVSRTHRWEVVTGSGLTLPGRPTVVLTVRPGRPASITADPDVLAYAPGDTAVTFVAVVRDSLGNAVPAEPTELWLGPGRAVTAVTDSLGRARFTIRRGAVPRGALNLRVRGETLGRVRTAPGDPVSAAGTGFGPVAEAGIAGTTMPLVFEVRAVSGRPLAGRPVAFRAMNARVNPEAALTDSSGQVRVEAMLGERAGAAVVFGVVDSLEQVVTMRVEPGVPVELRLERDSLRVDGAKIQVVHEAPFKLRLSARDRYGNLTSVAPVAQVLRDNREQFSARLALLQLLSVDDDGLTAMLVFKPVRVGRMELTIASGATATGVTVDIVRRRWP